MINITYKMILENTNTELEDNTGIQYSITIFEDQANICHEQVNLMFLFIYYFKLFVILASSGQFYLGYYLG